LTTNPSSASATDLEAVAPRPLAVRDRIARACDRAQRDPASVTLIAVTKGQPAEAILAALAAGATDFGENRVQEALAKQHDLASTAVARDARFHLIGHLQTNKVRDAVGRFAILHAVDSERLLRSLAATGSPVACMLQVNVADDAAKFGIAASGLPALLAVAASLPSVTVLGLMTVPPRADEPAQARPHFRALRRFADAHNLSALSMGMTGDFEVAIEEGATHVRVGRAIFGERPV
jgi:pyridoxal phosphate enzyme (YggS family)